MLSTGVPIHHAIWYARLEESRPSSSSSSTLANRAHRVRFRAQHQSIGEYEFVYAAHVSGTYSLDVRTGGYSVSGSPFTVVCEPPQTSGRLSTCTGDGLAGAVSGKPSYFTIEVDIFSLPPFPFPHPLPLCLLTLP